MALKELICTMCKKRNTTIHPHHLIPVYECIKHNIYPLIFWIDNGVTLCVNCHKCAHLGKRMEII